MSVRYATDDFDKDVIMAPAFPHLARSRRTVQRPPAHLTGRLCTMALIAVLCWAEVAVAVTEESQRAAGIVSAVSPDTISSVSEPTKPAHAAPRVVWSEDVSWAEIRGRAVARNQAILIDFYAPWCGPCKALDGMVYNDPAVIDELADVVTFKVDIDKARYGRMKDDFAVEVLPTLVWCDPDGTEFARFTGFKATANFLATIRGIRDDRRALAEAEHRLTDRPEDAEALLTAATFFTQRGDSARARVLYRRLVALGHRRPDGGPGQPPRLLVARGLLGLAGLEYGADRSDHAQALTRRAAGLFSATDPDFSVGLREIASRQVAVGDTLGALDAYRQLVELDDRDVEALGSYARLALQIDVDLKEASHAALRAAVLSDEDPRVIGTLAECFYRRGLYKKAIRWIQKSIDGDPDTETYRLQLAKYEDALAKDPWGLRGGRR